MSEWQPIETAPKDGTRVLLWCKIWVKPNSGYHGSRGWETSYELGPWRYGPTHWQPLPEPPEDESA